MKTQVAIVGAGPAGLFLSHLLSAAGIRCLVIERQARSYVESRGRAGLLETATADLLTSLGLDDRMKAQGLLHDGFNLADGQTFIHIDIAGLTGRRVTVYGQTEITHDLIEAAPKRGVDIIWEARDVTLHSIEHDPFVTYWKDDKPNRVDADFIIGCDGFHGVSRPTLSPYSTQQFEHSYPFGWLGILADVAPCSEELIYSNHERGFALASMRSKSRSRYYIQVPVDTPLDEWPDERLWDELALRLGPVVAMRMTRGPAIEKSIAPLRSYVFEPMQYKRLFLAGDAAHIVPPTGAKGLNLAVSDVTYLSDALIAWCKHGRDEGLLTYSDRALARVWKAQRFSWYLTKLMHRFPKDGEFERRMQLAELDYISTSTPMQKSIAENYAGLLL